MRQSPAWIIIPALLAATLPAGAQQTQPGQYAQGAGTWPNFAIYRPAEVAPVDLADSPRIDRLISGGKLHLSLSDAVALALENNLDIALARYGPQEADAEILRTRGGGATQGLNTAVSAASTGQSAAGPGAGTQVSGLSGTAFQTATGGAAGGGGGPVANLDPVFTSSVGWNHFSNPQSSDFVSGTSSVVVDTSNQQLNYSQGFLTGTSYQLNFTNSGSENNIDRNNFNPSLTSRATLTVTQRLTQGFGRGLNSINIVVAKNNREISDLAFKEQVMATVNSVVGLYWDLVGFSAQVEARRRDLELSEKLLRDNQRKVELGLLAGIEVMRSEAQVATSRNALTQAIRTFREQEVVLKNALSKNGPSGAAFSGVAVVPTDRIVIPEVEPIEPLQDLVALALQSRPNLVQSRINLTNSDLRVKGVRNAMLPSLDLVGTATNNALAGTVNPDLANIPGVGQPNPFFVGGFGTALGQIFRRNFPDYGVRLQLTIPLKNRQAQADMTRQLIARRRQDLQIRQQENDVKLQVEQALVRLQQARSAYEQARDSRALQEKLLDAEERSFAIGNSNNFQIVQVQQNLAAARVNEITSMTAYIKARADLDFSTGRTLDANSVSIDEAFSGNVTKNPDPLPPNG